MPISPVFFLNKRNKNTFFLEIFVFLFIEIENIVTMYA